MIKKKFYVDQGFVTTVEGIQRWQRETFPGVKPEAALDRLKTELVELEEDLHDIDELADCFIVMCQLASSIEGDLGKAVERKMTKNLNRQWKISADGTGQHIKEESK